MLKKSFSVVMTICLLSSAFVGFQNNVIVSAKEKSVTDYTYTVTPILEPFNEYFFVKTDNPDPTSFRFADKSSKYSEDAAIVFDYDDWNNKVKLYADINYENKETARVNGGYIFKSFNTDGGEVVLQSKNDAYYSWNVTWSDTNVKFKLSSLKDNADYLIDTYADKSNFFDNMSAVQSGFSSICLYSGSNIRGTLVKTGAYWSLATAGHIDQSFYIFSPYDRKDSRPLFATAVYPFRYDSLGFPGMMGTVSKRLDSSSSYQWNSSSHAYIDVAYKGETHTYGGQGTGEGQGISEDKIKQYFTFGQNGTNITLTDMHKLLQDYAAVQMEDDIPREDALTWEKIYEDVGDGAWARLQGNHYAYFYRNGSGDSFWGDEWGVGYNIYWGGDLGYARDMWVDGRYVGEWRVFIPGEKFEDHSTSDMILNHVTIPQVTYDYKYEYNYDTGKYEKQYSNIQVTEKSKTALFWYDAEKKLWIAGDSAFDDGWKSGYSTILELTEKGLLDEKYLDMVTITPDEAEALQVDRNTDSIPDKGFNYDGTVEPGTPYEIVSLTKEGMDITLSSLIFTFDGWAHTPGVTVTYQGKTLKKDTDYTLTYSNESGITAGVYTVKIEGIGDYKDSVTKSYRIVPQANSIKLDKTAIELCVGENSTLKATTDPSGASAGVVWTSSNTKVATVDNGIVTGVSKGTATITAKTNDGKTASCTVKVGAAVTGVTLSSAALTLDQGETSVLTATVMPSDAGNKTVTWTSSDEKVAAVSGGIVTAKSGGTATITATTINGKKSSCEITVVVPVTRVDMNKNLIILTEGKSYALTATIAPGDATDKNLVWTSSNQEIATVSDGKVKAVHEGSATITATASNGKSTMCKVIVRNSDSVYVLGDVNGDNTVDIADALLISQFDAGLIDIDESQRIFADVNKDGSVDIADALLISRLDAGLISAL